MITVDTNTQRANEVLDAFKAHGYEPVEEKKPEPKPEAKTTESAEAPGDKIPAEAAGGTDAPVVETKTQETDPAPTQTTPEPKKNKGGFQAKLEKLTSKVGTLQDELDAERGDKTRIAERLAAAQAELEALKGGGTVKTVEPEKATGPVRPKRPEMPDLAEFDYDQDKYQAAMKAYRSNLDKFDAELDEYHAAVADQKAKQAVAEDKQKTQRAREEAAAIEMQNAFVALKDRDAAEYDEEEWAELVDNQPNWQEVSPVLPGVIMQSEIPGHLMMYLYQNPDELERISKMVDYKGEPNVLKQTATLSKIEDKVIAQRNGAATGGQGQPEAKPVAASKVVVDTPPPAKPKQKVETPDAPLNPVGARTARSGSTDYKTLQREASERGDTKEYQRLRALEHQEKHSKAKPAR